MAVQDPYVYPGTDVLINIPGFTDPEGWKRAETAVIAQRLGQLEDQPVRGDFDLSHLQAVHARLVEGFYTWGGQLRTTDTGPGGTGLAHCRPEFILAEAERIFTALHRMNHLRGRQADEFSAGLAWVWGETTVLHPFRDVNTRSQFVFFNQLAVEAGWIIDWSQIDPHVFAHARTVAIARDEEGIEALIRPALLEVETVARQGESHVQAGGVNDHLSGPRPVRSPRELDAELIAAIRRRRGRF
mgnify:CR=1 FL=1